MFIACISCDEKEKDIILERQSLSERQKALQQEQDRLLDAQALLNQREDYIFSRSQELNQLQKVLENTKRDIETEQRAINAEKSNLELTEASMRTREEVHAFDFLFLSILTILVNRFSIEIISVWSCIQALSKREAVLNEKEQEVLVLREKLESKESVSVLSSCYFVTNYKLSLLPLGV